MTDATTATLLDAIFAMDAYEHNAGDGDGSWNKDLKDFFPDLINGQLGDYTVSQVSSTT